MKNCSKNTSKIKFTINEVSNNLVLMVQLMLLETSLMVNLILEVFLEQFFIRDKRFC